MSSSLSNLVDNLADINCEKCDNKCEYNGFRDKHVLLKFLIVMRGLKEIVKN